MDKILVIYVLFGIIKSLRFAEPFLTPILERKGFDNYDIYNSIYPVSTYSYTVFILLTVFTTKIFSFKYMMLIEISFMALTYILIYLGKSVVHMQLMQFVYGFASSYSVAYSSFLYDLIGSERYLEYTGTIKAATLFGHIVASLTGQILVEFGCKFDTLTIITCICLIFGMLFWFNFLWCKTSSKTSTERSELYFDLEIACLLAAVTLSFLTLWYVEGFSSNIWKELDKSVIKNGAVDALARGFAFFCTVFVHRIPPSIVYSCLLISFTLMISIRNIYVAYVTFCIIVGCLSYIFSFSCSRLAER